MDLETAKKVINNSAVQKYIEQIDKDADAALAAMKDDIGDMGDFPSKIVSDYKTDGAKLDKAQGNFNAAWNAIVFNKAKDGKAALSAYKDYVEALMVLEQDNVMYGAFVDANVAGFAALFLALLIEQINLIRKGCEQLKKQLEDLLVALRKAKAEVKEAEAQRVINLAITAVSLLLPEVSLGAGIAIAVTTFTVQTIVDASLGPGKPGVIGSLNSAAGDVVGLPKKMDVPTAKVLGAASGLYTLKMDTDEIEDAKKAVAAIQAKMKEIERTLNLLKPWTDGGGDKLAKLQEQFTKALGEAQSKAKAFRDESGKRNGLIRELQKLR